jgi:hypothetical protein
MGEADHASKRAWTASMRILGALELEGVGMIQPLHQRDRAKWYGFPADGEDVLGPFATADEAKRAVETARGHKRDEE